MYNLKEINQEIDNFLGCKDSEVFKWCSLCFNVFLVLLFRNLIGDWFRGLVYYHYVGKNSTMLEKEMRVLYLDQQTEGRKRAQLGLD